MEAPRVQERRVLTHTRAAGKPHAHSGAARPRIYVS